MAPRKRFVLVFTTDPRAADIVKEDLVKCNDSLLEVGNLCKFPWQKSTTETIELDGRILAIGTAVSLKTKNVGKDGGFLLTNKDAVGKRKQELAAILLTQTQAKPNELQRVAEGLFQAGPAAIARVPRPPRSYCPKTRSADVRNELQDKIHRLPCLSPGQFKSELMEGVGLWLDAGKILVYRMKYSLEPVAHFKAVAKALLRPILGMQGISRTGTRGCVGIPVDLIPNVVLYVTQWFLKRGGKQDDSRLMFNPDKIVTDLLNNNMKQNTTKRTTQADPHLENDDSLLPLVQIQHPVPVIQQNAEAPAHPEQIRSPSPVQDLHTPEHSYNRSPIAGLGPFRPKAQPVTPSRFFPPVTPPTGSFVDLSLGTEVEIPAFNQGIPYQNIMDTLLDE